jgi:hypothetical protein
MKIYIGDWPRHRPFYNFFEWLGFSNEKNHEIHNWLKKYKLIERDQIKFFKIDRHDVWSADYTLAEIIYHMLVMFRKENIHSYPCTLDPIDAAGKTEVEGWHYIVDELIYVFGHYDELMDYTGPYYQANQARVQKGLRLFAKYFSHLWD